MISYAAFPQGKDLLPSPLARLRDGAPRWCSPSPPIHGQRIRWRVNRVRPVGDDLSIFVGQQLWRELLDPFQVTLLARNRFTEVLYWNWLSGVGKLLLAMLCSWPVGSEPPCLPGKRYAVLQESSTPRADEHAIWDTVRTRNGWFSTGDAEPVRDLMPDLERLNRGEP